MFFNVPCVILANPITHLTSHANNTEWHVFSEFYSECETVYSKWVENKGKNSATEGTLRAYCPAVVNQYSLNDNQIDVVVFLHGDKGVEI